MTISESRKDNSENKKYRDYLSKVRLSIYHYRKSIVYNIKKEESSAEKNTHRQSSNNIE